MGAAVGLIVLVLARGHRAPLLPERTLRRVTFDEGLQFGSTGSPDGRFLAFSSNRGSQFDVWVQRVGGIDAPDGHRGRGAFSCARILSACSSVNRHFAFLVSKQSEARNAGLMTPSDAWRSSPRIMWPSS